MRTSMPDHGQKASHSAVIFTANGQADPEQQLRAQRRTVDFDTFDITVQQLVSMVKTKQIGVSPSYQRKFRWSQKQCSQFIESLMLGIPVPSLFMATNADSTWEVVDGVQRLSTIVKFAGDAELRGRLGLGGALELLELEKLTSFVGSNLDQLSPVIQNHFATRPIKVITLNDKSDAIVRYDLFERLNTGGVALSPQEIRNCVFKGRFADALSDWAKRPEFLTAVKLTPLQQNDATAEECVLRFFAFLNNYKAFDHNVSKFLNDYMRGACDRFNYKEGESIFSRTFAEIAQGFPSGIRRPGKKGTTPLNLFEGIAVGAALALQKTRFLDTSSIDYWIGSQELRRFTTGATNAKSAVRGRIEFCRDRFLGKPYVPGSGV